MIRGHGAGLHADSSFRKRMMTSRLSRRWCGRISRWGGVCAVFMGAITAMVVRAQPVAEEPAEVPAAAQSPFDGTPIRRLDVVGLDRIDESYVRNRIRTQAGEPYSQDQVQRDRARLLRTGRFLDVRAEPSLVDGQINLTFRLVEKPEIASVEFVGAEEFKPADLLKELPFAAGDPVDLYEVREGRATIERLYREKGYAFVDVQFDEDLLRDERRVVYTIVENQRVRVRHVRFEGNVTYSNRELAGQIETKAYIWIFRTGDFDPERAERDAATLQQYYRDRGFLDAEVSYVTEFEDVARENLSVIFRINEGTRYEVGEIRFEGNTVFTDEELRDEMLLKAGDFFNAIRLENDRKALETLYGSRGYIEAQITPRRVFAEEPGKVILTMVIREGTQFKVGWIEVNGNYRTQEKCVRREVDIYPEDIYDITKAREAERDLKRTGLFSEATIEAIPSQTGDPDVRDMLVTVEESPNTTQFIAGVGASSDAGILGNIMLQNTNFDLFDTPRSWTEFVKGRSFRGAGQTMRLQLEPGTELSRFRIDFREPYLLDLPIGFGTSAYLFERGRDGYDEERIGGSVSFDKRFEEGILEDWVAEIAFRGEYVDVSDRDAFAAKDIREVEGGNYLSSIKLSMLHDTTDSRFDPTEGHRLLLSWEQFGAMGGDFDHSELNAGFTQHWTVAIDEQDRHSVVTARARVGQILGDAPVFERFYAGGIGSMRGFDYRGISPRDGLRHNRVGGEFMVLTGAEYSFPLYAKAVRGVFFLDMGTVEPDFGISSWRASVGTGVRLTLDIFGTVPMEFDFAIPVSSDDEDDERIFSFFIGLPFF
jgi:outer membrane protein insertion porin family